MRSRGQGMIEYGLIIALVAVVVIATLRLTWSCYRSSPHWSRQRSVEIKCR